MEKLRLNIQSILPTDLAFGLVGVGEDNKIDFYEALSVREKALLSSLAKDKRIREFSLGRCAAKQAILSLNQINQFELGYPLEILRDETKAPLWPEGLLGSISHCSDVAVAVVGRKSHYLAIGIDLITSKRQTNENLLNLLCSTPERIDLLKNYQGSENSLRLKVFCIKESLYKLFSSFGLDKMKWEDFYICSNLSLGLNLSEVKLKLSNSLDSKLKLAITDENRPKLVVQLVQEDDFLFSLAHLS